MNKTRMMLVLAFVGAFAAGSVATIVARPQIDPPSRRSRSSLTQQLDLTPEQQERMREIWDGARAASREKFSELRTEREKIRTQRDQEIIELLGESTHEQYRQIIDDYNEKVRELYQSRRTLFDQARQKTNELLMPEQREQWEQMMQRRRGSSRTNFNRREDDRSHTNESNDSEQ